MADGTKYPYVSWIIRLEFVYFEVVSNAVKRGFEINGIRIGDLKLTRPSFWVVFDAERMPQCFGDFLLQPLHVPILVERRRLIVLETTSK